MLLIFIFVRFIFAILEYFILGYLFLHLFMYQMYFHCLFNFILDFEQTILIVVGIVLNFLTFIIFGLFDVPLSELYNNMKFIKNIWYYISIITLNELLLLKFYILSTNLFVNELEEFVF